MAPPLSSLAPAPWNVRQQIQISVILVRKIGGDKVLAELGKGEIFSWTAESHQLDTLMKLELSLPNS